MVWPGITHWTFSSQNSYWTLSKLSLYVYIFLFLHIFFIFAYAQSDINFFEYYDSKESENQIV